MTPNAEFIRSSVEEKLEFVRRCGLRLLRAEPGHISCMMPADGNQNHIGSMYAGALFTLAEIPGGALWLSSFDITQSYPILKAFRIEYLKPALGDIHFALNMSADEIARLTRECADKGKVDFTLTGECVDAQGSVVARTHGEYQLRKHQR